ncbi:hypothetical protein [Streptomyces sp. H27-C3]|uniref:hypothetical protein n=1 Tax=Streptomyces sp. H27-C3 TaxID=3046305 RepID=UPI0024B8D394|nr:hypothetical protein [Streptomyces sp. H27-C3]MDJ0462817.1 hypothetical protein [Streptomyces sp. H27-C3]
MAARIAQTVPAFVSLLPRLLDRYSDALPLISAPGTGGVSPGEASRYLYGAAVVAVVLRRPHASHHSRGEEMKARRYAAVLAVLTLTVAGCSEKAGKSDDGKQDAEGVRTGDGVTAKTIPQLGVRPTAARHPGRAGPDPGLLRRRIDPAHRLPGGRSGQLAKEYEAAYPKDGLDNGVVAGCTGAKVYGEVLKTACADKNLPREGIDKALLTLNAFDSGFGLTHDFSDPAAPSTRESLIMKPDKAVPGGLKAVREAQMAKAAESFTVGG